MHATTLRRLIRAALPALIAFAIGLQRNGSTASLAAADSFPYEATVSTTTGVVHAAPTSRAYATDTLARGSRVEVYRHDPGGWCAIRPPQGSFSLVSREVLQGTADPNIARVAVEGAKAWVGTRITHRSDPLWQVKLAEGELVELLVPWDARGTDEWILIAPPAGEFRWIHERELSREAAPPTVTVPTAPRQPPAPTPDPSSIARASHGTRTPAGSEATVPATETTTGSAANPATPLPNSGAAIAVDPINPGSAPAANPAAPDAAAPAAPNSAAPATEPAAPVDDGWHDKSSPRPSTSPAGVASQSASAASPRSIDTGGREPSRAAAPPPSGSVALTSLPQDFEVRHSAAQRAFDRVLIGETGADADLKLLLESLDPLATTAEHRQSLRLLKERVARWESLELRRLAIGRVEQRERGETPSGVPVGSAPNDSADGGGRWQPRSDQPGTVQGASATAPAGDAAQNPYAASGTLSRLIRSGGQNASSYALQDDRGRVVAIIVPAGGLNLERYLKKEIGIVGPTSTNPTLGLPTVVAERVIDLERHR
ncbi:MAG TPA: hypothetical protein PLI18_17905 [Pirellulaceae bacterium]|nr:hypothetical protein [Pirellulaceae bacterium]